jgi:predicted esterase
MAIIPEGRTSDQGVPFRWPFSIIDTQQVFDEEFAFHDDLLACAAEQFNIDKECVSAMGVSAGAMFSAQLAGRHGDHLASFISLSGAVGGDLVQGWTPPQNHMPALVLWGGPDDFCLGVDFNEGSINLEGELASEGHFTMECIHNCTHATPPFEPADPSLPTYAVTWEFFLDHPYWLEDGESPYLQYPTGQLPPAWPQWCAIGAGNASIRVGECGGSEC